MKLMFNKILIISGTTEGRELSEWLVKDKINHHVLVASEYGENMMDPSEYASVHVGRMDAKEMEEYLAVNGFTSDSIIIDATHPYAEVVSSNAKAAAEKIGSKIVRVLRASVETLGSYSYYENTQECAEALSILEGNILITTGSKELSTFTEVFSDNQKDRLYVRVLPNVDSINMCLQANIKDKHIIAMHGPFDKRMNEAIMAQYDIKHLVTKESGSAGGFLEKLMAADAMKVKCHIIARPVKEEGVSVQEAYELVTGKQCNDNCKQKMVVTLAGIGMGSEKNLTEEVKEAINNADVIFGAQRLLAGINKKCFNMYLAKDIIPELENSRTVENVLILYSGDTGFYSGARAMYKALKEWNKDIVINVLPGISSVSYLASRLMEAYDDACIYTLHGRGNVNELIKRCQHNRKTFCLLSGDEDIRAIGKKLIGCAESKDAIKIYVGANLSYDNERIDCISVDEATNYECEGILTALIVNENISNAKVIPVKSDSDFIRDKVPMTKEVIRHESIIALNLKEQDVVFDIGGGTGSVAIEIAGLSGTLDVYTIEKKAEAVNLIRENANKHNVSNLHIIEGDGKDELQKLVGQGIVPDAVFIGGSSGEMEDILTIIADVDKKVNVVINAVSLETINEVNMLIDKIKPENVRISQLQVSNVNEVGNYHMMKAENPVMIFAFTI